MRRWTRWGASALLLPALWLVACGDETAVTDDEGGVGGSGGSAPPPTDKVDLLADTNRDGIVDGFDNEGEELWSVAKGAAFLPNLDDDNADTFRDADNDWIDFTAEHGLDLLDLSPMKIPAWADAPEAAVGKLYLDPMSMPHVRVFKLGGDGVWYLILGIDAANNYLAEHVLTAPEIKAGVELAVEGRTLVGVHTAVTDGVPWSGTATFTYGVWENAGAPGPMVVDESNPDGVDELQMRVAPWIMFGNATPYIDTLYTTNTGPSNQAFRDALQQAADEDPNGVSLWVMNDWNDRWTEDWMQTGFVSIPGPDGTVHGMRLAMPRPFSQGEPDPPIALLRTRLTYQDQGHFVTYKAENMGSTYDSHGNHDLIPGYEHNGQSYPYGRIIYGSAPGDSPIPETGAFYEAQLVQTPALIVDTSWLWVGHVDEVFSYVPANTERGWKLLVGSPALARTMLEEWQAAGNGAVEMFIGKSWGGAGSAAISIDEVLADVEIMAWSQESQGHIDGMLATIVAEVGLAPDEIIEIPYLFEKGSGMIAYNPGTVNSRVFNNAAVVPDPFGPMIGGVDGFKQDLLDRLATPALGVGREGMGMQLYFADNWTAYHINLGEVHCGTNFSGPPAAEIKWWEAAQ